MYTVDNTPRVSAYRCLPPSGVAALLAGFVTVSACTASPPAKLARSTWVRPSAEWTSVAAPSARQTSSGTAAGGLGRQQQHFARLDAIDALSARIKCPHQPIVAQRPDGVDTGAEQDDVRLISDAGGALRGNAKALLGVAELRRLE
jgi:hypothetical protein